MAVKKLHFHTLYMHQDSGRYNILPGYNNKWKLLRTLGALLGLVFLFCGPIMEYFRLVWVTKSPILQFSEARSISNLLKGKPFLCFMHECTHLACVTATMWFCLQCVKIHWHKDWFWDLNTGPFGHKVPIILTHQRSVYSAYVCVLAFYHLLFLSWACKLNFCVRFASTALICLHKTAAAGLNTHSSRLQFNSASFPADSWTPLGFVMK